MTFDQRDPAFIADPYPAFAALREAGEVHHHEQMGVAVAVSHAACSTVLRHRSFGRIWSDAKPVEQFMAFNLLHRNSMLENEPPTHTRLRRLVAAAFGRATSNACVPGSPTWPTGWSTNWSPRSPTRARATCSPTSPHHCRSR